MSRRNTIIIAVLVNAGLLLVLFATAMRSTDKKTENAVELAKAPLPQKEATASPVTTEELLNEYIASTSSEQEDLIVIENLSPSNTVAVDVPIQNQKAIVATPVVAQEAHSSLPAAAPIAHPVQPKAVASSGVEVSVKKGDYLERIAKANNTTVNAIMKANNLSSTQLKVGQVLKMPSSHVKEESAPTLEGDFYIVKEGDSPWVIASKCHVKLDELLRLNNIDEQKAKRIRPGDKLRIR